MAKCDFCGTTILFGGKKEGAYRFCGDKCLAKGYAVQVGNQIPPDIVDEHTRALHGGDCPKCSRPGPVDIQTSHTVWSALLLTSWKSHPEICCRSCGVKKKLGGLFFSLFFGWWGFPWGIIITPVQVLRNFFGLFSGPDPYTPSKALEKIVRTNLAYAALQEQESNPTDDVVTFQ